MGNINPAYGSLTPSQQQLALQGNYLAFNTGGANDFIQQYLPEVYEAEVERYGNRTLSGFLRMVGAEMPMSSDQVIWSEQNRLHISYEQCNLPVAGGFVLTIPTNALVNQNAARNAIFPNDTIVVMNPATGVTVKGIVGAVAVAAGPGVTSLTAYPFQVATWAALGAVTNNLKMFVYGSIFAKGTSAPQGIGGAGTVKSIEPRFTQFSNQPIILKDSFQINGSDMAQIGWVEVATEDGTGGYLWYLKSESETRLRFDDYLEMAMVEGEQAIQGDGFSTQVAAGAAGAANLVPGFSNAGNGGILAHGTQGLFAAIQARGNIFAGFSAGTGISDFDQVLKNLDTQGAIEENMLFLNRSTDLDFDDMLGQISAGFSGGVAYGLFENSQDMALNLGFSGFRRGSYDFYKTSWKYLNDMSTRGGVAVNNIDGVLIPAGTSTVYDQQLGTNIRRPFLHVRYRASQGDDRRYKNWITGSAGGAYTSQLDAMQVNWLSERCLITQAANNFVLFQS